MSHEIGSLHVILVTTTASSGQNLQSTRARKNAREFPIYKGFDISEPTPR
jgi:hypothetical protein